MPRWVIIVLDLVISAVALILAYLIRFDLKADQKLISTEWQILSKSILVYFAIKFLVYYFFKVHKGLVRHTSTEDLRRILLANLTCSSLFLIIGFARYYFVDGYFLFPTTVLIMEFFAASMFMLVGRFVVKLLYLESKKSKLVDSRVLIYGAGISGLMTKRTIEKDPSSNYQLVGFLDDNKKLSGSILEGVTIFHSSKLDHLIKEEGINTVIIAIQKPEEENRKRIVDYCFENEIVVQKVPSATSWVNGQFSARQLSKINIEDLLGRSIIKLDSEKISKELTNQVVLVTGAAGSIGSGMVKQILTFNPKKIVLVDIAESGLYDLANDLQEGTKVLPIEIVIGDIRNFDRMNHVFHTYKPSYVLHAAAYKHVPLMEENPSEAILTNIFGTKNLADLALQHKVYKFVMISTDKAVNPTSVMGASKRVAEMYVQKMNAIGNTKFVTTRFGNVLGSNGSVIPLFQRQIEQGGPVTITDERITRYFMTIPEACQLVLEASAMGAGGEIFVFDLGKSVKIIDLAKNMIKLSGLELGKDIEIKVTGLRPGEKLYEELLATEELTLPTHNPKILIAKTKEIDSGVIHEINVLIGLFASQDNESIVKKMKEIVPEYVSNNSKFEKLDKK